MHTNKNKIPEKIALVCKLRILYIFFLYFCDIRQSWSRAVVIHTLQALLIFSKKISSALLQTR